MRNEMTRAKRLAILATVVENDATASYDKEDMLTFINHEIEMIEKKSTRGISAQKKSENETLCSQILSVLALSDNPMTATQVAQAMNISVQKARARLADLIDAHSVERKMEKKTPLFSIATGEEV